MASRAAWHGEEHRGEPVVIGCRGYQAAATTKEGRTSLRHHAEVVQPGREAAGADRVKGGKPVALGLAQPEPGVGHPERPEYPPGEELVKTDPRGQLDHPSEHIGRDRVVP